MITVLREEENLPLTELQIITFPKNCKESWLKEAIESTKNHPVNLRVFQGNVFGPLHLRQEFISSCKTPYLGWIDDDDILLPETINKCVNFLEKEENKSFCGVFTRSFILNDDTCELTTGQMKENEFSRETHLQHTFYPESFMLLRREAANFALEIPSKFHAVKSMSSFLISAYASLFGDWKFLEFDGYIKRKRQGSLSYSLSQNYSEFSLVTSHCSSIIKKRNRKWEKNT